VPPFLVVTQRMELAKMYLVTATRFLITGPSLVGGCAVSQLELRKLKSTTLKTHCFSHRILPTFVIRYRARSVGHLRPFSNFHAFSQARSKRRFSPVETISESQNTLRDLAAQDVDRGKSISMDNNQEGPIKRIGAGRPFQDRVS
jgi:hypothetical protein